MRTASVIKSISLSAPQLKRRHLLFDLRCNNAREHMSVRKQFHSSYRRWQQQPTPFQHQESERQQYQQQQQQQFQKSEFPSAVLYPLIDRLKYRWATALGKIIFGIIVAFLGWVFNVWAQFYSFYSEITRAKRIAKAFEEVSLREKDETIETGEYIPRPDVEKDILKLFELKKNYALIYGEHGVGKTTTVNYVVKKAREQEIPVL
jgi:Cdc6-like AAA superfamily ATPase